MTTRRTSPPTQAMIDATRARGVTITGPQIERWTTLRRHGPRTILKLAPDLAMPLPDRMIDYYCELASRVKLGSKGNHGVIVGMAYVGYHDMVDDESFRADLLAGYMGGILGDAEFDDAFDAASRSRANIRPGRNPEAAEIQKKLKELPTGELRDFPELADYEGANILSGGTPNAASLTNVANAQLVAAGAPPLNPAERAHVEASMRRLRRDRVRNVIMVARIADIVSVARIFSAIFLPDPNPEGEEWLMVMAAQALTSGLSLVTLQQMADDLGVAMP